MYVLETVEEKNLIQDRLGDHGMTAQIEDAFGSKRRITFANQEQKNQYQTLYSEPLPDLLIRARNSLPVRKYMA